MSTAVEAALPAVGERIVVEHECAVDGRYGQPLHREPVIVNRVVGPDAFGHHRVETTRCDGSGMHVVVAAGVAVGSGRQGLVDVSDGELVEVIR